VSSFLLISFWWRKDGTLQAGYLALGANAIGDAALLIALVLVPKGAGELTHLADISGRVPGGAATLAILLVIAASAKSAQGPLFFWLPSAMAGPTPVSALIHAATMVAAGVYLLVRTSPLLAQAPDVMTLVAVLGTVTALGGGLASLWQSNFKRGLAYSTASQLGYMFAAVGVGAPFAATFHLVTHASFKAMLFLAAGIVIHATHEEELKKLGGLRKKLPVAHALFLIGSLAMIGFPFLAGAYSKDAILEHALEHSPTFGWILTAGALLTGLYTGRLFFGVFYGPEGEASQHYDGHHKPSALLQGPLVPLALGAIGLGYIGTDLHDVLASSVAGTYEFHAVTGFGLAVSGLGLLGFLVSGAFAVKKMSLPAPPANLTSALWDEFKVLPQAVSMVHNGQLGRYAMITLVGAGLMVFLGLRPVSAASLSTAQVKPRVGAESAPVKRRVVGPVAPSLVPVQPTLVPTGPVPSTTEPILHPTPVPATPDAKPIPPDAFKPSSLRAQFEAAQKAKAAQKAAEAAKAADAKPKKAPADAKGAKAKPKKTVGGAQ
jgi:NADH-quinone oxidoreductase subunit L